MENPDKKIRFTKKQIDYITHRPEDCLAEHAMEEFPKTTRDEAHGEAIELIRIIEKNRLNLGFITEMQIGMLKDCFQGSTYHCAFFDEGGAPFDRAINAGRTAAKKLEPFLGTINVPVW